MAGILCHSVARIAQCPETSLRIQKCFCQPFHTHFTRKVSGSLLPFKPLTCFFQPSSQTTQCVKNLNSKLNLQALVTTQRQFSSLNAPIISKNTLLFGRRSRACFPRWQCLKQFASQGPGQSDRKTTIVIYFCAVGIFMVGASYAGVPLYRIFCQATGLGGQAVKGHDINKVEKMVPISERVLKIRFNADVASSMQWNFRPQQTEVKVVPGETALAFYTARNPTSKPIIGISTYNVVPFEAGQYFNKIQCFCFEEQRLNPHEQVDMPVFFFIDPEFAEDPKCAQIETITLSYTFFEAKEGLELPYPGYASGVYAKSAS